MGATMVEFASKNAIQILFFALLLNKVNCTRPLARQGLSPLQEVPQYRFHYFVQDDNLSQGDSSHKIHNEHKNDAIIASTPVIQSGPVYNAQVEQQTPIVVEPMESQIQQKSSKSIEPESNDDSNKQSDKINLSVSGRTEDRQDDDDKDSIQEQIYIQNKDESKQPTEFTIPFKQPNTVGVDDIKYDNSDEEAMKKDIVKVIQNINGAGLYSMDQSNSHVHMKNGIPDKPIKIFNTDSMESDHVEVHSQSNNGESHINFKSQQLSNKPLRLFGYNPLSIVGLTQDMDIRPQPILGTAHGSYFYGDDAVKNVPTYDASPTYSYYPPVYQYPGLAGGGYKGGISKYNSAATQQLYYYDPNSMLMIPIYQNTISGQVGGYQPYMDNGINTKPQPQPVIQSDVPNKKGFNLMQILNGGTYYKSSIEQAEGSQTTVVKDIPAKQDSNKQELIKTDKLKNPTEDDKSKPVQTLMLYLSPNDSPLDLKTLTSSPIQLMVGQQPPQNDCIPKNKTPVIKEKPLPPPIPLCSDCVPALGLIGLPNNKAPVTIQTKISATAPTTTTPQPQIMPIWNGQNTSKFNYLILPNPITK